MDAPDTPQLSSRPAQFDFLLHELSVTLNALHQVEYPKRFWGILLHRYIWKCIRVYNDKLPLPPRPAYISGDDCILEHKVSENVPAAVTTRTVMKTAARAFKRMRSLGAARFVGLARGGVAASLVTGFHYYDALLPLLPPPVERLRPPRFDWHHATTSEKRARLAAAARLQEESPLVKLAYDWLPAWYVEHFDTVHRLIDISSADARKIEIHASFLPQIEARMAVAKYVSAGAILKFYQHSGAYGEIQDHLRYHAEASFSDAFLTWGWKLNEKDRPFLALRLMAPHQVRFRSDPKTAEGWIYVIGRDPTPTNLTMTLEIQNRFFEKLKEQTNQQSVIVRTRTDKGGSWRTQVGQRALARASAIDDGRASLWSVASNAQLIILDTFPSTVFMEYLAAGIPVIAILPENISFTSIAQSFYGDFLSLGLLHRTPEAAAEFLNEHSLSAWWCHVQTLDVFRDYLRTFCNRDESQIGRGRRV